MSDNQGYEIWGMEENSLREYLTAKADFKITDVQKADFEAYYTSQAARNEDQPEILTISGDTAIMEISGILRNRRPSFFSYLFGYGGTSYKDIIKSAQIVAKNKIKTLNILGDTPGGEVKGLDETWQVLMDLRSNAEIIFENRGLVASAGYYLATAAHEIVSSSESNFNGSIGIAAVGYDRSKLEKDVGIKKIVLTSSNAPKKHLDFGSQKDREVIKEMLNTSESFFFKRISEGRGLELDYIKANFGRGGLLVSQAPEEGTPDAISVKMIDGIQNNNLINKTFQTPGVGFSAKAPETKTKKQENRKMSQTLTEFLAENSTASAEFAQKMADKYQAGFTEGQAEINARIERAFKFTGSDAKYPKAIQDMAIEVAKGETSLDAFEAVVKMEDMRLEREKSGQAQDESEKIKDTPGGQGEQLSADGKVRTEDDYNAKMDHLKTIKGMKK